MSKQPVVPVVEEAVSHVAYALSDLSYLVQPVAFGQALEQYIISARRNVFDQVGKVEESPFGQELIERAYAASKQGQFVTLFASSPSALLQMVPTMYKLSSALLPAVVHVVAREHSDLMAVRQTGFVILNSLNASETEDMALLAHVASLRANVPFLHVYDGDMNQNELERKVAGSSTKFANSLVSYQRLAELIGLKNANAAPEFRQLVLSKSTVKAEETASDADLYFQVSPECIKKFHAVPGVVQDVIAQVFASKGYQLFEYYGHPEAEHVVVIMGTGASIVKDAVESLYTNWKAKVGVISVRLFRPWSTATFLSVVPASATKIAVLDRMEDVTNVGEPLFMDVLASFQSDEWKSATTPSIIGGKYAFGASDAVFDVVTARSLVEALAAGSLANGFVVAPAISGSSKQIIVHPPSPTQEAGGFEAPYVKMLLQLFEKRAVIANLARATTIWKEQDDAETVERVALDGSGEFGFGVHLGILAKRQQLKDKVVALLGDAAAVATLSQRLVECLMLWTKKQSSARNEELASEIAILLENEAAQASDRLAPIVALKRFFAPLSQWIVGSEEFSRDIGASGVHQVLKSGENVNLLILDTEPMHSINKSQRKRDLGLYAMQYGNAYVASVALYDSYSQVLRALNEADAFDGPSIVLAYAPAGVENMEKETREAVNSGYWPLYRYNPLLEEVEGEKAFALESPSIKKELLNFLQRNNQLSLFAKQALTAPTATQSVSEKYEKLGAATLDASFQALLNGFGGADAAPWQVDTKLTVLVGSDNGHAEEFAGKFVAEALSFGLKNVHKMDMNDMTIDTLLDEANDVNSYTLFVCSTAGQGEFPSNAKEFWHELAGFTSTLPLQFAVFGMGDSHYWPRPDEKHYFCKAPADLDAKLSELGAKRLLNLAKADDQDQDGPTTQYEAWKPLFWESIGVPVDVIEGASANKAKKRTNEDIKRESNYLRGGLAVGLEDRSTKALPADDTQLTKFHGIYQQDDRDLREQMRLTKQEKAFSFMIRVRVPGGVSTAEQYLMIDQLADSHANGNIKVTTRQAYQLQGILKWNLKPIVQGINRVLMDSLAACGDVNRNVMTTVNPSCSVETHNKILDVARDISAHLTPKTSAYHEIWLDKKMVAGGEVQDFEPMYGPTYLPRKFKIAIAIPPSNDVDVFAHCLGFIAVVENDELLGFNVTVGGGMGMTHNNQKTFPRLADVMAFCTPEQAKHVAEHVMIQQRDHGDRVNRKHARYKYTVEDHGLAWIREDVEKRLGYKLEDARPFRFENNSDRFGWHKMSNGLFHYTMFIEGGRIRDTDDVQLRTGLRKLAQQFGHVEFHLTANQNLSLVGIHPEEIGSIKALMAQHRFGNDNYSGMRLNSIACAALPFCGLAFAESERYLPTLITKIEETLFENGLRDDAIVIRMTGCANGCGRPYLGEIGFVGRSPGIYNMYLGAGHSGMRLNKLYKEGVDEETILKELAPIIKDYAQNREEDEKFGDFVIRQGYVKAVMAAPLVENRAPGETFHA